MYRLFFIWRMKDAIHDDSASDHKQQQHSQFSNWPRDLKHQQLGKRQHNKIKSNMLKRCLEASNRTEWEDRFSPSPVSCLLLNRLRWSELLDRVMSLFILSQNMSRLSQICNIISVWKDNNSWVKLFYPRVGKDKAFRYTSLKIRQEQFPCFMEAPLPCLIQLKHHMWPQTLVVTHNRDPETASRLRDSIDKQTASHIIS